MCGMWHTYGTVQCAQTNSAQRSTAQRGCPRRERAQRMWWWCCDGHRGHGCTRHRGCRKRCGVQSAVRWGVHALPSFLPRFPRLCAWIRVTAILCIAITSAHSVALCSPCRCTDKHAVKLSPQRLHWLLSVPTALYRCCYGPAITARAQRTISWALRRASCPRLSA
jgi:hypothetical protein